jgi:hypothetical protein
MAGSGVFAMEIRKLTEDNIRSFVEKTTEITSYQDTSGTPEDIRAYLDAHLHKKGYFKSTIRYIMPGFPSQENVLSLDKDQFIDSILSGQNALEEYETDITVKSVKISRDGKRATVVTSGQEGGTMAVPGEDGKTEEIPVSGSSECDQILKLEDRTIKMYSAICKTDIRFEMPF